MHLNHVTLVTGHTAQTTRAAVSDDTVKDLKPWLESVLAHQGDYLLPGPLGSAEKFAMSARLLHGGLVCHVGQRGCEPLVTFGVSNRSSQSSELWAWLCAKYVSHDALTTPGAPWCAVAIHPALLFQMGASSWLGDFERCVAWTWLERKKT